MTLGRSTRAERADLVHPDRRGRGGTLPKLLALRLHIHQTRGLWAPHLQVSESQVLAISCQQCVLLRLSAFGKHPAGCVTFTAERMYQLRLSVSNA